MRPSGVSWLTSSGNCWLSVAIRSSRDIPLWALERSDLILAEHLRQNVGRNRFVRTRADPGLNDVALAALLKLLEQVVKTTTQHAAGGAAGKEAAQWTLKQSAKATTGSLACGRCVAIGGRGIG